MDVRARHSMSRFVCGCHSAAEILMYNVFIIQHIAGRVHAISRHSMIGGHVSDIFAKMW